MQMQTADDLCLRFRISRPVHAPVDASPSARRAADWVQGACVAEACAVDHQLGQTQLEQGMSVECSVSPARLLDGARRSVALTFSGSLRPDFSAHANDRGLVGRAGRFWWRLCGTRPRDHDRSPRLPHARVTIGAKPPPPCPAVFRPVYVLLGSYEQFLPEWLLGHAGVEVICRDRGAGYRKAATKSAPRAQQVLDRWHVLKEKSGRSDPENVSATDRRAPSSRRAGETEHSTDMPCSNWVCPS